MCSFRSSFTAVSQLLSCPICKELFENPVSLPCKHVFCSLCIRRSLLHKKQCALCREPATESRLHSLPLLHAVARALDSDTQVSKPCFCECHNFRSSAAMTQTARNGGETIGKQSAKCIPSPDSISSFTARSSAIAVRSTRPVSIDSNSALSGCLSSDGSSDATVRRKQRNECNPHKKRLKRKFAEMSCDSKATASLQRQTQTTAMPTAHSGDSDLDVDIEVMDATKTVTSIGSAIDIDSDDAKCDSSSHWNAVGHCVAAKRRRKQSHVSLSATTESTKTECPVCRKAVATAFINSHLDSCLRQKALKKVKDPKKQRKTSLRRMTKVSTTNATTASSKCFGATECKLPIAGKKRGGVLTHAKLAPIFMKSTVKQSAKMKQRKVKKRRLNGTHSHTAFQRTQTHTMDTERDTVDAAIEGIDDGIVANDLSDRQSKQRSLIGDSSAIESETVVRQLDFGRLQLLELAGSGSKVSLLAIPVYSQMTDRSLRDLLKELKLRPKGSRSQLIATHKEFVVRHNAQRDAIRPLTDAQIVAKMKGETELKAQTAFFDQFAKRKARKNVEKNEQLFAKLCTELTQRMGPKWAKKLRKRKRVYFRAKRKVK